MVFQEKKEENGYTYKVQDVFGEIEIKSSRQLKPDILDEIVLILLKQDTTTQITQGEIKSDNEEISYKFIKVPIWEDDNEECKNIPTLTQKQVNELSAINQLKEKILNLSQKLKEGSKNIIKKVKLTIKIIKNIWQQQ